MHEQNGVAEQMIRTITEGTRAMLFASKLPKNLWSIAVRTMGYLCNRNPTRANDRVTPLECIAGQIPDLAHLRIFGCPVSIAVPKEKRKKWDSRSKMGYMVGYEPYPSGYLVWYPKENWIHKARDVIFHEDAIAPATPTLFSDESTSIDINEHMRDQKDNKYLQSLLLNPASPLESLRDQLQPALMIRGR